MSEPLWTSQEIAQATGGRVEGGGFAVAGVSIDSRSIEPGDLFIALAGARDGHEFVAQALERGAAAALVSRPVDGPAVVVEDTFQALEALGVAARERAPQARRGAVTGSVGKTSVTQAVRAGLTLAGPAHSSVKSYNNHIGVPLTLARMPRETARAVFEIGMNHADEITPLSQMVRPHAAVITTVGPVHVENFPDGEIGVARAKAEIFAGLVPGGAAILNADNAWFDLLAAEARAAGATVMTFGTGEGADARLTAFSPGPGQAIVRARLHGRDLEFPILQTGFHWGLNSMAVLLMLEALEVRLDDAVAALGAFEPLAGLHPDRRELQRQSGLHGRGHRQPRRPQARGAADRRADRHAGAGRRGAGLSRGAGGPAGDCGRRSRLLRRAAHEIPLGRPSFDSSGRLRLLCGRAGAADRPGRRARRRGDG